MSSQHITIEADLSTEQKAKSVLAAFRSYNGEPLKARSKLAELAGGDFPDETLFVEESSRQGAKIGLTLQSSAGFEVEDLLDALERIGATTINGTVLNDQVLEEYAVSRPRKKSVLDEAGVEATAREMPLVTAVERQPLEVIDAVLRRKPRPTSQELNEAAARAIYYRDSDVLDLLLRNGVAATKDMLLAALTYEEIKPRIFQICKLLIDSGLGVNCDIWRGMTPLMYAVEYDSKALLLTKHLLAAGANVNVTDRWGESALHCAIKNMKAWGTAKGHRLKIVGLLLEHGADPTVTARHVGDPAAAAAKWIKDPSEREQILELLSKATDKADFNSVGP